MEKMTISELSNLLGKTWTGEDGEIHSICTAPRDIQPNCAMLNFKNDQYDMSDYVDEAMKQGASVIISKTQIGDYPCIVVDDIKKTFDLIGQYYKKKYRVHTVGVTGSTGKTTAKEMIYSVLSEHYNTLKTGGSANSPYAATKIMLKITPETEAVVLEMGMSQKGVISRISQIVAPDIAVITNIGFSHIQYLKSQERILQAKLEILHGMSDDGHVLLNIDDKILSTVDYLTQKTISFSIRDRSADYYADNIVLKETGISFDIVHGDCRVKATLNCFGEHNIYNALAAYIVGKLYGIPEIEILEGIGKFRTSGVRQNIFVHDDVTVIADCYNAAPDSMETAFNMLSSLKKNAGGRDIAVLADMLELGDLSVELHQRVGQAANQHGFDYVLCYGVLSQYIADEISNPKTRAIFMREKESLVDFLSNNIRPYDRILFKGSNKMNLEEVIKKVFENGTVRRNLLKKAVVSSGNHENNELKLHSKSALLANLKTGEILYEKDADLKIFPAGTTKIIAGAIALEKGNCDEVVKVADAALTSSVVRTTTINGLSENEEIKFGDLVILMMLSIGNDAANMIAEHLFGSRLKGVEYANEWIKDKGMQNSNLVNLHGLHHEDHYTTAKDMLLATQYAMSIPDFRKIVRLENYKIMPLNKDGEDVYSTNLMLDKRFEHTYYHPDCIGVKIGNTKAAGYCSVEVAVRGGVELCALCFGAPIVDEIITSYVDSKKLFDYGFDCCK